MNKTMEGGNKNAHDCLAAMWASAFLFVDKLSCNTILARFAARAQCGVE